MFCFLNPLDALANTSEVSLKGAACTETETWVLRHSRYSKNESLTEALTQVPSSESSAIQKWNHLKQFSKTLNANPGLEGAWSYWYYRAAVALNMNAYAESGFMDLVKKLKPNNPFAQATQSCLQVLNAKFKGAEEKADRAFFNALQSHDVKKVYFHFKGAFQNAKAQGNTKRANSLLVLYAQDLYQRGKFKDSVLSAQRVDKTSDAYPQALLVMAWSAFRLKDYKLAVGHSFSLMKSYPQSFEALEAIWMASAAFLESCLNKESQKTLEFFKSKILTLDEWVKKNQPAILKDPYAFYKQNIQNREVPFLIKREWLKSGRLFDLQNHLNSLVDEQQKIAEWKKEAGFYRIAELERQVNALKDYYQKELGKEFFKSTAWVNKEIEAHIEKGQLLETDILGALGQSELEANQAASAPALKVKPSLRKKVIWARAGFNKGIGDQKGEVWLDDIGNFVGDFKNTCKP